MAITSGQPAVTNPPGKQISGQPAPFRATGRGFYNKLPLFPATEGNANASLTNLITNNDHFRKLYLFVSAVETGWELAGEGTQSQTARAFYPRNLSQDELTIEGVVASQYDYDLLVRWVQFHQYQLVTTGTLQASDLPETLQFPGVIFQLYKPKSSKISMHPFMRYMVVITNVASGHQVGQMAGIPFQLTCKVVYDYIGKQVDVEKQIKTLATVKQVFGDGVGNPQPFGGWDALVESITVGSEASSAINSDESGSAIKQIAND